MQTKTSSFSSISSIVHLIKSCESYMGCNNRRWMSGNVAYVTYDNPPDNSLTIERMSKFGEELQSAANDKRTRLIVIQGADHSKTGTSSRFFSWGLDAKQATGGKDVRAEMLLTLFSVLNNLGKLDVPVVTKMVGDAYAGGAVLGLAGDLRLCQSKSKICFSETKVGIVMPRAVTKMADVMRYDSHFDAFVLAKVYDAKTAKEIGFATHVFDQPSEADAIIEDYAKKLSRMSRTVVGEATKATRKDRFSALESYVKNKGERDIDRFLDDNFFGEGLAALHQGRWPNWKS